MSKLHVLAVTVAYLLHGGAGAAQTSDSVYAGRHCDNRLKTLRMPLLTELGDSTRLDSLLSLAADPRAHITNVELRFGKDGAVNRLEVKGARSSSAKAQLKDDIRTTVRSATASPRDYRVNLVRLNPTGMIRLLASTATCKPQQHVTPEVTALIQRIHAEAPETHIHRDAVVEFILEANGRVSDAWFDRPTGFAQVDSLAIDLFRAMRFDPAILGATPVASLVEQPFKF